MHGRTRDDVFDHCLISGDCGRSPTPLSPPRHVCVLHQQLRRVVAAAVCRILSVHTCAPVGTCENLCRSTVTNLSAYNKSHALLYAHAREIRSEIESPPIAYYVKIFIVYRPYSVHSVICKRASSCQPLRGRLKRDKCVRPCPAIHVHVRERVSCLKTKLYLTYARWNRRPTFVRIFFCSVVYNMNICI